MGIETRFYERISGSLSVELETSFLFDFTEDMLEMILFWDYLKKRQKYICQCVIKNLVRLEIFCSIFRGEETLEKRREEALRICSNFFQLVI